ncbi:MAG: hypothetical protein BGN88_03555 [Clostridiales bacterium 43-6]|nr:MAG: hypothetical protein BGN88_03555 [Clostridiales bacterium 43-6]
MKNNAKSERLELRLSLAEKQKLEQCAKRCGVSVSSYVKGCCMNKAPRVKPPDEFWLLLDRVYTLFETAPPETQTEIEQMILKLQELM